MDTFHPAHTPASAAHGMIHFRYIVNANALAYRTQIRFAENARVREPRRIPHPPTQRYIYAEALIPDMLIYPGIPVRTTKVYHA